jgi:anti-sigma B factor antagonist
MTKNATDNLVKAAVFNKGKTIVLKVFGRATHDQAGGVKDLVSQTVERGGGELILFDLSECEGMDSTFMGVMVGVRLDQKKPGKSGNCMAVNVCTHCGKLLKNLGLTHLFDVMPGAPDCVNNIDPDIYFVVENEGSIGHLEKLELMLKAHENLVEANESNKEEFKMLIELLKQQKSQMKNDGSSN